MSWMILLYGEEGADGARAPLVGEALAQTRAAHRAVQRDLARDGALHAVAQLDMSPDSMSAVVRDGADALLVDGPFMETKEWLLGVYLFTGTLEEAQAYAARLLVGETARVVVRAVSWMRADEG